MAFVGSTNAFALLSLLLCTSLLVHAHANLIVPHYSPAPAPAPHHHATAPAPHHHDHHHHHHHAPTPTPTPPPHYPPVKPPTHSPVKPPTHSPVKPPARPPVKPPTPSYPPVKPPTPLPQRKKVAVEGMVYCKSCKYRGVDTLTNASTLAGATVKLQCNNTRVPLEKEIKTDKNGYFFLMPDFLTTFAFHKCKVSLVSSPHPNCKAPTNLHGGLSGAVLRPAANQTQHLDFTLFSVGPFAFDSQKGVPCHY